MLSEDFPKVKPMKVKKVSTPKKKISVPAVRKHPPIKSPKRRSKQQATGQDTGSSMSEMRPRAKRSATRRLRTRRKPKD